MRDVSSDMEAAPSSTDKIPLLLQLDKLVSKDIWAGIIGKHNPAASVAPQAR